MRRLLGRWWRLALLVAEVAGIAWWVARNGPPAGGWAAFARDPSPYVGLGFLISVWTLLLENIISVGQGSSRIREAAQDDKDRHTLQALAETVAAVRQTVQALRALALAHTDRESRQEAAMGAMALALDALRAELGALRERLEVEEREAV